jgi:hypothetical protein
MVHEYYAIAVASIAMDGAAPELNTGGFVDGRTVVAQCGPDKYLQLTLQCRLLKY